MNTQTHISKNGQQIEAEQWKQGHCSTAGIHRWNSRHILIVNDLLKRESRRLPTNKATQDQPRVANLPDPRLAYVCLFVGGDSCELTPLSVSNTGHPNWHW